jgi:hypothetical protein
MERKVPKVPVPMAWHYTNGDSYVDIIKSGVLSLATIGISEGEKPVLWFTINQEWEPTVNGTTSDDGVSWHRNTMQETKENYDGLYRFGISSLNLIPWVELVKVANIPHRVKKALEKTAIKSGSNPFHWLGSLQPIDISDTFIETMDDTGKWVKV